MKHFKLLTVISIIITSGCSSLKNLSPATYQIEPIKKNEFAKINGRYKNIQDTVFGKINSYYYGEIDSDKRLLDRLFIFFPRKGYSKEITVEINFVSNKKASVRAYQNETMLFTKSIRGKFKKGYFYVRPKIFIIPFFPVYYWHNFERARIGIIENSIVIDHYSKSWGFALIAGGSEYGHSTVIYKRCTE
jgi:hypothetical protein